MTIDRSLLPDRIWGKIEESDERSFEGTPCWEWQGSLDKDGYGRVKIEGKVKKVHRVLCEVYNGDAGPLTEHKCNNRQCCHPAHTKPSTQSENMKYMVAQGRAGGFVKIAIERRKGA